MALEEYKRKRKFDKTPEPTGGKPEHSTLEFVVQKHHASHLHYDFRIEIKGVMKSWAIPKGPSVNPEDHRLAMATEDHPMDYNKFEGIIPKGQYGGGTVIIWDKGTFTTPVVKVKDKITQEHSLMQQYYKGEMLIDLKGKKLKGQFAMFKTPDRGENAWVLMKVKDKHGSKADVLKKGKSVVSGLTIEEMKGNQDARKWQSNREEKGGRTLRHAQGDREQKSEAGGRKSEVKGRTLHQVQGDSGRMPDRLEAMNATLIKEPFTAERWLYEVKWDGYRILARKKDDDVKLHTRGGLDYADKYPVLVEALQEVNHDVILDGEVVVVDKKGVPSFDELQKYKGDKTLLYYVFDILWLDGEDLTSLALTERKEKLLEIIPEKNVIRYSDDFENGEALFKQAQQIGLEGIVAKKKDSKYQPGVRSKDWLKCPTAVRQEFVIGGWTESASGREFRSILFGAYDKGELRFVGHSGSGFKDKVMNEVMEKLKPLAIKKKPFVDEVDHSTTPHWVKPVLVGNFKFSTWTAGGKIRKPAIFLGFRDDKDARDVPVQRPEDGGQKPEVGEEVNRRGHMAAAKERKREDKNKEAEDRIQDTGKAEPVLVSTDSNWPELEKQPIVSSEVFEIEGKELTLTNVEKELWPGVSKADLIQYYHSVAPYILPYLFNRPLSLHIKHIKATAPGLYIKDMEGRQPEWATVFSTPRKHKKKGKRGIIDYLVCNDEATLLYVVNLGCIDINPWTSTTDDCLHPNFIIIDLDPSDNDFRKAIETAKAAKQYFDEQGLKAFPKTSGKTGIHLYVPCEGFTFPQARKIAEHICRDVNLLVPGITTTAVSINQRGDKLYVDPNQNDEADTVAAPYSVRPYHHPSVSTPLEWKEINNKLNPLAFDIHSIHVRLKKKGDLFNGAFDKNIAGWNAAILKQIL